MIDAIKKTLVVPNNSKIYTNIFAKEENTFSENLRIF